MTALPTTFPRVPLKAMDSAMLVLELDRETGRLMPDASELITSAVTMAGFLHRHQTRSMRGDLPRVPYIEHPLRVALRLVRWGVTDPQLIAAGLLHDTLEDAGDELAAVFGPPGETPPVTMARLYGARIATLVSEVTNPTDGTSYHDHIAMLAASGSPALLVKASDLKDNAGSIGHQMDHGEDEKMLRRARKYATVIPAVVDGLDRIGETGVSTEMTALARSLWDLLAEQ